MNAIGDLPVLGICGWSGAGKTTLIEHVLPEIQRRGLRVAVVKHDAHGLDIDRPGKDSDRFFQAGADVFLNGPAQECSRYHKTGQTDLLQKVRHLARRYDLVLVEGHKNTPLPKIWLASRDEQAPPSQLQHVLARMLFTPDRPGQFMNFLDAWLPTRWRAAPLYACVLIGGKNRRMGRPKHLLRLRERTWLEHTAAALDEIASDVVLAGPGHVPEPLSHLRRLPDAPDADGPIAGILAAMQWAPDASWLVAACNLPYLSPGALRWLVSFRRPGLCAALPKLAGSIGVEPLLAYYDVRAGHVMEQIVAGGSYCPADIAANPKVDTPTPPAALAKAWKSINTPTDIKRHADLAYA